MATRNVYRDAKGLYFKGRGLKFYIASDAGYHEGGKVTVMNVTRTPTCDCATYVDCTGYPRYVAVRGTL